MDKPSTVQEMLDVSARSAAIFALFGSVLGSASALAFGRAGAAGGCAAAALLAYLFVRLRGGKPRGQSCLEPAAAPAAAPKSVPVEIPADRIDGLTGLANENGLLAWFSDRSARLAADGKGIVVLVAKLDDFRLIESRGEEIAKAVLVEIAARVAVVAGSDGIAARTDGEEFASVVAVVPDKSEAIAAERAGHLVELLGRPVELPSGVIWVGGSVGAASGSPADGPGALARARAALSQAVRQGRGQCVVSRG